jgi:uroporphyrinogen-III synthase
MAEILVITRPQKQAVDFAERLRLAGRDAVVFPLLDIAPLQDTIALRDALDRLSTFSLVAFVSPNAIDAAFAHVTHWPSHLPLAVMGEGSVQALARHGVTDDRHHITRPLDPRRSDSQTLLEALDVDRLRSGKVLILRGETGRELLADALREAGAQVEQVAAYRRSAVELTPTRAAELTRLLDSENSWIITSSEALHILMQLVARVDPQAGVEKIQRKFLYAPHPRIVDVAHSLGFRSIRLTDAGDDGLFSTLQSDA